MKKGQKTAQIPKKKSSTKSIITKGYGACTHFGCKCEAYVSDSTNKGYCICGHEAAEHAF